MKTVVSILCIFLFVNCSSKNDSQADPVKNMSAAEKYYYLQKIRKFEQEERYQKALQEQEMQKSQLQQQEENTFNPEQDFLDKYNIDYYNVPVE